MGSPSVERVAEALPQSPTFIPTLSSQVPDSPESVTDTPIQSHANVDLATLDCLNSASVAKLRRERDRLELGGLRKRRASLHQLDRSTWPTLLCILQLYGQLPGCCSFEDRKRFGQLKLSPYRGEDLALDALEKQRPAQKSISAVDLCAKVAWRVDPRLPIHLSRRGNVKQLMQIHHPTVYVISVQLLSLHICYARL